MGKCEIIVRNTVIWSNITMKQTKNTNFVNKFISFNALFCVVPFNIRWDNEKCNFTVSTLPKSRKFMCALLHLNAFRYSIILVKASINKSFLKPWDLYCIFNIVDDACSVLMVLLLTWIHWRKSESFVRYMHRLEQIQFHRLSNPLISYILGYGTAVFLYVETYQLSTYVYEPNQEVALFIETINETLAVYTSQTGSSPNFSHTVQHAIISCVGAGLYLISYLTIICFNAFEVLALLHCLALYETASDFVRRLQRENSLSLGFEFIEEFTSVIEFFKLELKMEWFVTILAIDTVTYYTQVLHITSPESELEVRSKVHMYIYFFISCAFWSVAAEIHHDVSSAIKKWTHGHQFKVGISQDDRFKLLALANEYSNGNEAAGLSCRLFHVTYTFLLSMTGVLVTYAIILYQFSFNGYSST